MANPLDAFSPSVRRWFARTFGEPTPPQAQGWPAIQRGEHTLILAPTGSGKTIAAFLWGIDRIFQEKREEEEKPGFSNPRKGARKAGFSTRGAGVRLLYVSPLKALNNDIERNLRAPLEGIREVAHELGEPLPPLRVMVRTGDTPGAVRQQMVKNPPDILITTPESLYLMLTSPKAREMFKTVQWVIVDEIHTLAGSKRGAHLALSLERLEHLAEGRVQRIGLSATIRPLEEAARFLGGQEAAGKGSDPDKLELRPRPVTIVDAHYQKAMDLKVVTVVDDFRQAPGDTIWPSLIPQVLDDVRRHRSTLIFTNSRRLAERTADRLNAQLAAEQSEEIPPGGLALLPDGVAHDTGIFAIGAEGPFRAHHGSMSKEARHEMEEQLKAGELPALVGTSSLELGIDIGAVDLVVQLQSPKSVSQGLQRVGRSGHLVGQTSRGRIYPTFREDLAEAAAVVRGMLEGDVELTHTPENPLDVLAQQIVAMVAVENWSVPALYRLVRQAYPYRDLPFLAFHSVLAMLAGSYYSDAPGSRPASSLRAKIAWDRVHNRLAALPGSRLLAMGNVGTIPDTGAFGVYLNDGKTKVGELDEEFVFETRIGDAFLLGSNVWRVFDIKDDRVIVADAGGSTPRMPFWHGDLPYRPFELGERIGRFRRDLAERIRKDPEHLEAVEEWLERDYALDKRSARNLIEHIKRQIDAVGVMSSDKQIVVEAFQNAVGDPYLVVHSPFGGRVNGAWALALRSALRERTGVDVEMQANDDGILLRLPQSDREPPFDVVAHLSAFEARERILHELPHSAVFGAHFRMNAARALLLSRSAGQKRTPFWLSRLKAKDLLAYVSRFEDFPIVVETYRDCLRDVLDVEHLDAVLQRIADGEIQVTPIETVIPSPVAAGLLLNFSLVYVYEWDTPKAERSLQVLSIKREALQDVLKDVDLSELLKPEAIRETVEQAQHLAPGYQARTAEELAVFMAELGDLTTAEIEARCAGEAAEWIKELAAQGRIVAVEVETARGRESRWVLREWAEQYADLKGPGAGEVLARYLRNAGPVTQDDILARYGFDESWLAEELEREVAGGELARGHYTARERNEFCDSHLLEQIHRRTLAILRHEIQPVPIAAYADFLTRWQSLHPANRASGTEGLRRVLGQLRGMALPGSAWERDILPARVAGYSPADLDALCRSGELVWVASGADPKRAHVRFLFRGDGALFLPPVEEPTLSAEARAVYDYLKSEGASFATDLQAGLKLRGSAVSAALSELALAGLATNDSAESLRHLIEHGSIGPAEREENARPASALEKDLGARLGRERPLTRNRYYEAKRRVAQRVRPESQAAAWSGRWTLIHRPAIMGPALAEQERAAKLARVLLSRYGVVSRECVEREEGSWDWATVYPEFQRLEMRGQVRRGYFVAGLSGLQYALPEAVEQLRASSGSDDNSIVLLSAVDPANPFGSEITGAPVMAGGTPLRLARLPSTYLALQRGQPILVAEDSGDRLSTAADADEASVARAVELYLGRRGAARHVVVTRWNGENVIGRAGEPILRRLGFTRTPGGLEWWAGR